MKVKNENMNRKDGDESKRDREAEGGTVTQRVDKKRGDGKTWSQSYKQREIDR